MIFLTIDLNPFKDLHEQFAAKLYEKGKLKRLFLHPEFSFSFKGITFSIDGDNKISNITTLIETLLNYLKKKKKRVLITIDDISNNDYVHSFIFSFQQMIRNDFDVFLLLTGLYENVSALENKKSLTFFLRVPKLMLQPLNIYDVAFSYEKCLNVDQATAIKLSKLCKGYAYGYQLLGSLIYQNGITSNYIKDYDIALFKNSYYLSWQQLTIKEKEFLMAMSETKKQNELIKALNISNGQLQIYKRRLIDKGLIISLSRGNIDYALPRFKQFVIFEKEIEDIEVDS